MSTQRVSLEALEKIRHYLKTALAIPDSENYPRLYPGSIEPPAPRSLDDLGSLFHFGSIPEETLQIPNAQGQWFISATNPGTALIKLPGLRLKPDFRLVTYLYRAGDDGTSAVWALPEALSTTAHLEKALLVAKGHDLPPQPEGALPDVMDAIAGDRSPMSFVIASLLRRELLELGCIGRMTSWTDHSLIDRLKPELQWQWRIEAPTDLSAKVRSFPDGRVAIKFFTCRVVPSTTYSHSETMALFQHIDQYLPGQYRAKRLDRAIAQTRASDSAETSRFAVRPKPPSI